MLYQVKREFWDSWGIEYLNESYLSWNELYDLSNGWGVPLTELMEQVEEV